MLTSILHLTPTKKQSIYISGPLSNLEHKASETLTSQIILEASTLYSPAYYYRLLRLCDPKRFQKKSGPSTIHTCFIYHVSFKITSKQRCFYPGTCGNPHVFRFPFCSWNDQPLQMCKGKPQRSSHGLKGLAAWHWWVHGGSYKVGPGSSYQRGVISTQKNGRT